MFYTSCRALDKPSYVYQPASSSRLVLSQQVRLWQLLAAMDQTLKNNPDVEFVEICNLTSCFHFGYRTIWIERSMPTYAGCSRRRSCRLAASWYFKFASTTKSIIQSTYCRVIITLSYESWYFVEFIVNLVTFNEFDIPSDSYSDDKHSLSKISIC